MLKGGGGGGSNIYRLIGGDDNVLELGYMASAISAITDIRPESDIYAYKCLCSWYAMHAPDTGTKHCWLPEVRYLGSVSEEKALSICTALPYSKISWQYIYLVPSPLNLTLNTSPPAPNNDLSHCLEHA